MWKKYFFMICTIMVMVIIFLFSSQTVTETTKTSDIIKKPIESVVKQKAGIDDTQKDLGKKISKVLTIAIRKCAHMFLFGALAGFVLLSVRSHGITGFRCVLITFIICFIYACSDELHQMFVDGRNARVTDIFIDSTVSIMFIIIERMSHFRKRRVEK